MRRATLLCHSLNKNGVAKCILGQKIIQRNFSRVPPSLTASLKTHLCDPTRHNAATASVLQTLQQNYSQMSHDVQQLPEFDKLYSRMDVECRGHDTAVLQSYLTYVSAAAGHLDINLQEVEWPKKHIQRWTLLKSVHIYKKHRVQYEVRTHFMIMKFVKLTESTADTFLEYIQRNLPEGVAMKVTKHELQNLPEHVKPSSEVIQ